MKKPIKLKTTQTIETLAEAEAAVNDITGAMIFRRELESQRDAKLLTVRSEFDMTLKEIDARVQPTLAALGAWAEANPAAFKARRSIEFAAGTIGFRTSPPKLKTLKGFTWDAVLRSLSTCGLGGFIRVKEEVDKESLIAARRELSNKALKQAGLALVQEKLFYVEPALSTPQAALRQAA